MSSFEFFFSFYGLLLALSVAVIASGAVKVLKRPPKQGIGWLTPLLAVFLLLDIATFWQWAWDTLREARFSYGLLVAGMVIALIYFVAASFVFPDDAEKKWKSLDDHYDARKRIVLVAAMISNTLMVGAALLLAGAHPSAPSSVVAIGFWLFYVVTLTTCCLVRNRRVNAVMLGLNIALYIAISVLTLLVNTTPVLTATP